MTFHIKGMIPKGGISDNIGGRLAMPNCLIGALAMCVSKSYALEGAWK